ncbi:DUF1059 domain-containing protein [Haloferax mediterranei ATCC 33500]|uniref:DUF1059 domain-containing protein n=1 Tax=Haloferax mediterranei (strain ATCC 33500 / DSM 1411 / JCM 8866 / NBRC 14739 / NCIMB 2177 / R-4) TaxID=523841 RepID=I3R1A4_HALMT|nr:DUF1059 domain-containing protein [Haloferax mediterranei]AFK18014.1 hypothetical protein HFX_0274 [Haloferax mediterranei ATCC 33500]EMA02710.1 hypothetical protein C439_09005 [Haloferax mediterranei ATCC 33500]MDX5988106.1 DUF1059 domain-containing protein [Haloferax mediterranei ATCC 33500]QCQ74557.1 DUF1059 domain-containing protein [Haloferax mediterranei ATCC 33500]
MTKRVVCRDAGHDCDFSVQSENEAELIEFVQQHAEIMHDLQLSESDVRGLAVSV